jgi:acylphosphatase
MKAVRVFYEGRVQGVGFRWTAKNAAKEFEVTGHVKNLPDGRVELLAVGDSEEVELFLEAIRDSGVGSHIAAERREDLELHSPIRGFQIVE